MRSVTEINVRYGETDQMGIVHHSNYINYFEVGRIHWLHQLGISYSDMEHNGIILPVISVACHYKKSAYFDDNLTILTEVVTKPSTKIEFAYTITNQHNELICNGNTVLAFVNKKTNRPVRCPNYFLDKFETN